LFVAGNLTKLTNLNLDRNRLEFLPTEIGNLVNLGVLSLRENRLLELPAEIGNCRELHVLDVCGNKLQHLPFSLTSINLKVFYICRGYRTLSFRNFNPAKRFEGSNRSGHCCGSEFFPSWIPDPHQII
jgi:hypothetical protein